MPTLAQKFGLLQNVITGSGRFTGPIFVDVDVTTRCNLQCVGCPYHAEGLPESERPTFNGMDFPPERFEILCDELAPLRTSTIYLQGSGEPLLHPRIVDFVRIGKSKGFEIVIISNGTLLDDILIDGLIDSRLDQLRVSLWASSEEQYGIHYPGTRREYFARTLQNIRALRDRRNQRNASLPHISLHHVITAHNYRFLREFVRVGEDAGCDSFSFSPFSSINGIFADSALSPEQRDEAVETLREVKDYLDSRGIPNTVAEALLRYRIGEDVLRAAPCYVAWYHARIRVDGSVYGCGSCDKVGDLGKLGAQSLQEIWTGPTIQHFRQRAMDPKEARMALAACNCLYCCFAPSNWRMHQRLRPLSLLLRLRDWAPDSRKPRWNQGKDLTTPKTSG